MGEEVFMKVIKIICNIIQFDLYSLKSTQWAVKIIQGCCFFFKAPSLGHTLQLSERGVFIVETTKG